MGIQQPNSMDYHSSIPIQELDHRNDDHDDDHEDQAMANNRQSVIKFKDVEDEDLERETAFVRQKTPHPKELKAKAHKLFGNKKPLEESNPESEQAELQQNGAAYEAKVQVQPPSANSESTQRAFFAEGEPVVHEASENNFHHVEEHPNQNEDEEELYKDRIR